MMLTLNRVLVKNTIHPSYVVTALGFVRELYPKAQVGIIYQASIDGWEPKDFYSKCEKKGWTLTFIKTTAGFTFGGFLTVDWVYDFVSKTDLNSFLFSVDLNLKFPITAKNSTAISCNMDYLIRFGGMTGLDICVVSNSNQNKDSFCHANQLSYKLPAKI